MSTPLTFLPDVTVGNAFTLAVQFTDYTQNFTTLQVQAYLAQATPPYGDPVVQFVPAISFPIVGNTSVVNVLLTLNGSQTSNLGTGSYVGDIVLTMAGYGPYTPISYSFNIIPGTTLNSIYTGGLAIVTLPAGSSMLMPNTVSIVPAGTTPALTLALPVVTGSGQVCVVKNQSNLAITITGNMFTTSAVTTYILTGGVAAGSTVTFINDGNFTNNNGYWNTISPSGS